MSELVANRKRMKKWPISLMSAGCKVCSRPEGPFKTVYTVCMACVDRRVATLEARLARVLRYAWDNRAPGAFGECREWRALPLKMRGEGRPYLVARGRVWSRKHARKRG